MPRLPDVSPDIREVRPPLTDDQLEPLNPQCRYVQFSEPLADQDYARLAEFLTGHPEVTLRAYGMYPRELRSLDFLRFFPEHPRVRIDILDLDDISGLEFLTPDLQHLGLGATRKTFSLSLLGRSPRLKTLFVEGHSKDIEAIAELIELEDLTLRSITLPNLSILTTLDRLRSLDIKLGGIKDLSLLPEIGRLEYVELWMVRGLTDVRALGYVGTLRFAFLQALRRVESLPDFSRSTALERLHLETMKGLRSLKAVARAPALTDLVVVDVPQFRVDDFRCLVGHPTLERILVGTGSTRRNGEIEEMLALPRAKYAHGLDQIDQR
jgi:hypothetical protein